MNQWTRMLAGLALIMMLQACSKGGEAVRPAGRDREKELRQEFGKVGGDYEEMMKKIVAAGGVKDSIPLAPMSLAPRPVVDANGNTNMVSHKVNPLANIRMFRLKDGRLITITVDGNKVTAIDVTPAPETND